MSPEDPVAATVDPVVALPVLAAVPPPSGELVDPVDALWLPAAGVGALAEEPQAASANVAITMTAARRPPRLTLLFSIITISGFANYYTTHWVVYFVISNQIIKGRLSIYRCQPVVSLFGCIVFTNHTRK
jgi:hypothetical protein